MYIISNCNLHYPYNYTVVFFWEWLLLLSANRPVFLFALDWTSSARQLAALEEEFEKQLEIQSQMERNEAKSSD